MIFLSLIHLILIIVILVAFKIHFLDKRDKVIEFPGRCVDISSFERGKLFLKTAERFCIFDSVFTRKDLLHYTSGNGCVEIYLDGEYQTEICFKQK